MSRIGLTRSRPDYCAVAAGRRKAGVRMRSVSAGSDLLERAYSACEAVVRSHYENFPVASHLLPSAMRPHVAAVYAFARVADDIADEGTLSVADRQTHLCD